MDAALFADSVVARLCVEAAKDDGGDGEGNQWREAWSTGAMGKGR